MHRYFGHNSDGIRLGIVGELHDTLLKDGLMSHTSEPIGGGTICFHVYASDQDSTEPWLKHRWNMTHMSKSSKKKVIESTKHGGVRAQRDDARRVYEQTIQEIAHSGSLDRRDTGKLWDAVHNHWQSLSENKGLIVRDWHESKHPRVSAVSTHETDWVG
jgi:hypothetical protein